MKGIYYLAGLLMVIFSGCGFIKTTPDEEVLAVVGEKKLMRKEISSLLPSGIVRADSAEQVNDLIQRWIKQELLLSEAEKNLSSEQKDFQRELDEYRSSLIIHKYQEQLLRQKLDTVLTDEHIQQFYVNHPEQFILDHTIIKGLYLEVPKSVGKSAEIKKLMLSDNEKSKKDLENFSFHFANKFENFNNQWVDFSLIKSRIPITDSRLEQFLSIEKIIEVNDSEKIYFVAVKDYRSEGDKAPFDFVRDRIESLILNNRKMEFIQNLENNIYETGKKENNFKIMQR